MKPTATKQTARPQGTGEPAHPGMATANTRRKRGLQLRLRLSPALAQQLRPLPATVRGELATLTLQAALAGVAVADLAGYRQQLADLALLIQQSLILSGGQLTNITAVEKATALLNQLSRR